MLDKLNKALNDAFADPAVRAGFERAGAEPIAMPLDKAKAFHVQEIAKYRDIIAKAGLAQIQ